jgi:enoyl-CoA hydratase/carnithine racemase
MSVRTTLSAAVGEIVIDRPAARNAIDSAMAIEIARGVGELSGDPACRAVIISGRGGDLSSGADTREPAEAQPRFAWPQTPRSVMLRAIRASAVPVIAAVDGWAVGLGLGIVGACTYAVVGAGSRFLLPEAKLGFFPYLVAPYLVRRVRPEVVVAWALSGHQVDAGAALASGLATEVCPAGEAHTVARDLAARLVDAPSDVVHQAMGWHAQQAASSDAETVLSWCEEQMAAVNAAQRTESDQPQGRREPAKEGREHSW